LGPFVPLHRLPGHRRRGAARRRVRAVTATGRYMGARVRRNEDARLLTGRALFVDDVHLDGMLHVAFLRSDYAHALPRGVDLEAALAPGAPLVHDDLGSNVAAHAVQRKGDYARARAAAHVVIARRFRYDRGAAAAIENRGIVAQWDPRAEELTLWDTTQA